jgi:hypothetical protein
MCLVLGQLLLCRRLSTPLLDLDHAVEREFAAGYARGHCVVVVA